MKFKIERASAVSENDPPCDDASVELFTKPNLAYPCLGGREAIRYVMNIDTIEDLLAFIDKYGDIVIEKTPVHGLRNIIIYDSYIE